MTGLTDRQREILNVIVAHFNEHGTYPTLRELGAVFGSTSTNNMAGHIHALTKKGFLRATEKHWQRIIVLRTSDGVVVRARLVPELGEAVGGEQAVTVAIPIFRSLSGMRAGGVR